uniref:Uncharacterized protein n=1 Tax=Daucus carota subsp. sativus TaxID=79200 RepID=A0A175YMA1_DAUCS
MMLYIDKRKFTYLNCDHNLLTEEHIHPKVFTRCFSNHKLSCYLSIHKSDLVSSYRSW